MSFLNQFPYSDFHEMNLDWILKRMKELAAEMQDFEAANSITYEGVWDITKQYQKWSIVLDTQSGYLKIAKEIVPAGIAITNDAYWMLVSPFKIDTEFDASSYNAIANKPVTDKFASTDEAIADEISAREDADEALDSRVTANTEDIAENTANIASNTANIAAETSARTAADETLSERLDNLVVSGSESSAEVIDARYGFNGITYDSLGNAIRGQCSEINGKFVNIESNFDAELVGTNIHNVSTDVHGYLSGDGSIISSSSWDTCDYIEVKPGDTIYLYSSSAFLTGFFRCFYNASKEVVTYSTNGVNTVTIPSGIKYFRISYSSDYDNTLAIGINHIDKDNFDLQHKKFYLADTSNDKIKNINRIMGKNILDPKTLLPGSYPQIPDGLLIFNAGWSSTDFIPVNVGEVLYFSRYNISTEAQSAAPLWFCNAYDENKAFISNISNSGVSSVTIPSRCKYIRFGINDVAYDTYKYQLEKNDSMTAFEDFHYNYSFADSVSGTWEGKKWTCVGDSLTEVNSRTSIHYFDYISSKTGIYTVNMGVSGTGYARGSDSNNAFYQRISNVPVDSDAITIFGSFNDLGAGLPLGTVSDSGTSTLAGCINTTLDNLFTVYPLAKVGLVTPTPWEGTANPLNEPNAASAYVDMIVAICKRRSIPCLDLFHESLLRPWDATFRSLAYSHDDGGGVHPDETGHLIIAPRFEAFLDKLLLH